MFLWITIYTYEMSTKSHTSWQNINDNTCDNSSHKWFSFLETRSNFKFNILLHFVSAPFNLFHMFLWNVLIFLFHGITVSGRGIHRRFPKCEVHSCHLHTLLWRVGYSIIYSRWSVAGKSVWQLRRIMAMKVKRMKPQVW